MTQEQTEPNNHPKIVATLEYVWQDAKGGIRSKTRQVPFSQGADLGPGNVPEWSFDGSSTGQALGTDSDCTLRPVKVIPDVGRLPQGSCFIVLCDVLGLGTREGAVKVFNEYADEKPIVGFEQEYVIKNIGGNLIGWPDNGFPAAQGPFYCSVGGDVAYGRKVAELHRLACLGAGLHYHGMNAEVMPGQWEFQIGIRDTSEVDSTTILELCDELILARYLLLKIAEDNGLEVSFDPKPKRGDWNGSGMHTNYSTTEMRLGGEAGRDAIQAAIHKMQDTHALHMQNYGVGNEERMTGEYETSHYAMFTISSTGADRGCSVRVPPAGTYLEDRRPAANACPYVVAGLLTQTICAEVIEEDVAVNI